MKEEKDLGNRVSFFLVLFIIALDQISKIVIQTFNVTYSFFGISIRYVQNTGAAFGLFQNNAFFLGIISIAVAIALIVYCAIGRVHYKLPYFLLIAGALGNGIDRIFRGFVIDFIDLGWWPVFNIADIAITIGVLLLLIKELFHSKKKKKNKKSKPL